MRVLLAMSLAFPLYIMIDFGWEYILIILLQILAGLDFKFSEKTK